MKKIQVSQNLFALVDDEDYDFLASQKWNLLKSGETFYAISKKELMHRVVLRAKKGSIVDHIDRNGLNNQKKNLRYATKRENGLNRKTNKNNKFGQNGVYWHKKSGKFAAHITTKAGKFKHVGLYENVDLAIEARKNAEKEEYGEFCPKN